MFPGDNPEIILYAAIKRPKDTTNYVAPMIKEVEKNITKYLNIEKSNKDKEKYVMESFYNMDIGTSKGYLEGKNIRVLVLGDGNKVTSQYPSTNSTIYEDDLVILKTNGNTKKMIDLTGYSYKEANNILKMMDVSFILEGNGYAYEQSVPVGEEVTDTVTVKLKDKY